MVTKAKAEISLRYQVNLYSNKDNTISSGAAHMLTSSSMREACPLRGGNLGGMLKVNRSWILTFIGVVFEVVWVSGFKHADGPLLWMISIASLIISFTLVLIAAVKLPVFSASH